MLGVEKPVYMVIMQAIEDKIISGEYKTDDLIISTTQISKVFSVNPTTAMRAISELTALDILYKKRGIGMCVAQGARQKITTHRIDTFYKETLPDFIEEATKLEIPIDDLIKKIKENDHD